MIVWHLFSSLENVWRDIMLTMLVDIAEKETTIMLPFDEAVESLYSTLWIG
jgi:hypothetical protein